MGNKGNIPQKRILPSLPIRDFEHHCCSLFSLFWSAIVTRCRINARMPGHSRDRCDVYPSLQQIGYECPPDVMGREIGNAGLLRPAFQQIIYRLSGYPFSLYQVSSFIHFQEHRTGFVASDFHPILQRRNRTIHQIN